jgi:hypothetical protein
MAAWSSSDSSDLDLLLRLLLAALVAAGLVVDAVIHARLAPGYQLGQPGGIGEGNPFRIEAAVAGLAALLVLVTGSRLSYLLAAGVVPLQDTLGHRGAGRRAVCAGGASS